MFGGVSGKLLAIVRESVSAALFGTGLVASAYRVAQTAFLIPVQGLLSEALASGFTPAYAAEREKGLDRANALLATMQLILVTCTGVMATLVICFGRHWVELLAPGFDPPETRLATRMVQIMCLVMPLYALAALYASAELVAGRATLAAARSTVQSVGLVAGTVAAWLAGQPWLIAAGFSVAYAYLAAWGFITARANGLRILPPKGCWSSTRYPLVRIWSAYRVLLVVPILMQVHFVVERRVASVVDPRAVAALDYARFISETAVLLLATPFALAGLASMSVATEQDFQLLARKSIRTLLAIGVPISAALVAHATWVTRVAFARGAFDAESILVTSSILRMLAIGIWAQLVGYAGARFLSARGGNRQVLSIYVFAVVANVGLNLVLGRRIGVAALGLASAINSLILGLGVMLKLKVLNAMSRETVLLLVAAAGYEAIWCVLPESSAGSMWAPPAFFVTYWSVIFCLVRPLRVALRETLEVLRRD
jgi:putative peptidoglycan lipid II flippase